MVCFRPRFTEQQAGVLAEPSHLSGPLPRPAQLRAARGFLDLTISQLAEASGLGAMTIKRAEKLGLDALTPINARRLVETFAERGVTFTSDADALGVILRARAD